MADRQLLILAAGLNQESCTISEMDPFLSGIAALVSGGPGTDLPYILSEIVETAARELADGGGLAYLFDYGSDKLYVARPNAGGAAVVSYRIGNTAADRKLSYTDPIALAGRLAEIPRNDRNTSRWVELVSRSHRLGILGVAASPEALGDDARVERFLGWLARYAVTAIEIGTRCRESQRLVYALSNLYEKSRILGGGTSAEELLRVVVENALAVSQADFVILYEYFAEEHDVRIPPATAGEIRVREVLTGRSMVRPHRESVVFRILERTEPFYAENGADDWTRANLMDLGDMREDRSFFVREDVDSSCGIPLRIDAERVGVLFANYRRPFRFTPDLRERIELFANQGALAIGNARFFLKSQRYSQNLAVLNEIGRELGATANLDIQQISRLIHDQTKRVLDTRNFFVCLFHEEGQRYSLPYVVDQFDRPEDLQGNLHQGLTGWVIRERSAFLAPREVQNRLFAQREATLVGTPSKIWLGAPMIARNKVLGAIVVQSYEDEGAYTEEHKDLLSTIASQAAIAIDNYRHSSFRRTLIDSGPHAIIAVDTHGSITEFNEASTSLLGYAKNDLPPQVSALYWGGLAEARRIRDLVEKQKRFRYQETFVRSKHGKKIPILLSAALLKNAEGEVMGSVGIMEDLRLAALHGRIRRLVEAIEKINSAEGLYGILEAIVEHSVTLLDGDVGCILLKENNALRVTSSLECDGSCLEDLANESIQSRLVEIAEKGEPLTFSFNGGGGPEFRLSLHSRSLVAVPIRREARLLALLLVESQETDHFDADPELLKVLASQAAVAINRVQLLEEKERTERRLLVSANAVAVGQIATSFIHETKNSLNGMTVTLSTLGKDLEREPGLKSKKKLLEKIEGVESEIRRMDELARRLQRFTRQGLKPEKGSAYLNEIVTHTLLLLESAIRDKNITLTKKLDASLDRPPGKGPGSPLYIDESQIQQVFMNLVLNAIAASPERGRLMIETRSHPKEVEVRITDFGKGIPEEVRGKIFEPFFTTKKEGTGLGLYISRILVVENHGGTIEFANPGKGTIFSIRLPRTERAH